jgi:hypothetical protein
MDPAFQHANESRLTGHVVFGLPLYPLTIGHVFLLSELDVTFLVDQNIDPQIDDMLMFAFVSACRTAKKARRALKTPGVKLFFWLWGLVNRRRNIFAESAKLQDYLRSQCKSPQVKPPSGETVPLNAPEHWRLLVMLMVDFHMRMADALDVPLNFARNLWAVQGEREQKLSLAWTPNTSAAIAQLKRKMQQQEGK